MRFEKILVIDGKSDSSSTSVVCRNDQYRFSLKKNGPDAPFVMVDYAPGSPDDPSVGGGFHAYAYDHHQFLLDAIDEKSGHKLKSLRWDKQRQSVYANLEVRRGRKGNQETFHHEIWLDPSNMWRIVERMDLTPTSNDHYRVIYGQNVGGLSYPVRIESTTLPLGSSKGSAPSYKVNITLQVRRTSLPNSAFRLSAFGLPEPVDIVNPHQTKPWPRYVWFLLGMGVLGFFAIMFRTLARRRAAAKAPA